MSFPTALDSTMIATLRACPQKMFREYIQHWKINAPSVHLHAGGAYAKALELSRKAYYEEGKSKEDSEALGMYTLITEYGNFECPEGSTKSLDRMMGALEFYYSEYPFDSDTVQPLELPNGKRAIEFTFAIPLPILHPDTQEPILYCGRCDMIGIFAGGVYLLDDKTTTTLGATFAKQWALRSQFSGYSFSAKEVGIETQGAIVRGLAIRKTGYDTQQVITPRSPFLVERWYQQLLKDVKRLVHMYIRWKETGRIEEFDFNLDHSCNDYGGCAFTRVCESPQPEIWLEGQFIKREWLPLQRIEKKESE